MAPRSVRLTEARPLRTLPVLWCHRATLLDTVLSCSVDSVALQVVT